jgi:tRNA pseudouridine13 synthase
VDLDGKVIHVKSIGKPASSGNDNDPVSVPDEQEQESAMDISSAGKDVLTQPNDGESPKKTEALVWQDQFATALAPFMDEERIQQVKDMYLQGRNPPRISDAGWAGRKARSLDEVMGLAQPVEPTTGSDVGQSNKPGDRNKKIEGDERKVVSEVLFSN